MTVRLQPFDSNAYRKRVLAAVEKRGGIETSDAFELYDVPIEAVDELDDATVAARVEEVWGFWQKQRDHPKYRVLVGLLVEGHAERSAALLDGGWRRHLAAQVRADRARRDGTRYELLDTAVSRLVKRHKGIPRDKVEGLVEIGALGGLTRDEVLTRLRRHRVIDPEPGPVPAAGPVVSEQRRRQVRDLLDEFGRLSDAPAPATLLTLLGLEPDAPGEQIKARGAAWRARSRELPPERIRAVIDELMVHVAELLEPGPDAVAAYLDAVYTDVEDRLRPRVRAAVLVEDRLVAEDHRHLLQEAQAMGLDAARAGRLLASLGAELGVPVDGGHERPASAPGPAAPQPQTEPPPRPWQGPLKAARAALRAGRLREASDLVTEASRVAGPDGATPVRAVSDEIAAALDDARLRWRAAVSAYEATRYVEAAEHLEHLHRVAVDVPGPPGAEAERWLETCRERIGLADQRVAAAAALPVSERLPALLAVLEICAEHPGASDELGRIAVEPASAVTARRSEDGTVTVSWCPSPTPEVEYKVSRERPDGSWWVVGRTREPSIEDGGAPAAAELPTYAVVARQAGRSAVEARTAPSPGKIDYTRRTPRSRPTT